jgi:hypothetical protein
MRRGDASISTLLAFHDEMVERLAGEIRGRTTTVPLGPAFSARQANYFSRGSAPHRIICV